MKVVGVVIWYNPSNENIENIKNYIDDLEKLYIIDNSKENNLDKLKLDEKLKTKIVYVPLLKNKGIAYALNIGLEKGIEDNADYILTLDQDSSFYKKEMLKEYFQLIENDEEQCALYGTSTTAESKKEEKMSDFTEVGTLITSGMMINLKKVNKLGKFKEELFIDEVDIEYCYRALKFGEKIKKANNILLKHKIGNSKVYKIFGKRLTKVTHHNYIRRYYLIRNKLYMIQMFPEEQKAYKRRIRREVKNIILFENDKLRKLKMCWLAYRDFKAGKMGEIPNEYLK